MFNKDIENVSIYSRLIIFKCEQQTKSLLFEIRSQFTLESQMKTSEKEIEKTHKLQVEEKYTFSSSNLHTSIKYSP